ncbi:MAG: hypothetical protein M3380_10570 [Chloroflexota bacterium]|nr:hypothetical protein [Chloroflexota bacterium]
MNDNDPRTRPARLEQTLAQACLARQRRTTARLLLVIAALVLGTAGIAIHLQHRTAPIQ